MSCDAIWCYVMWYYVIQCDVIFILFPSLFTCRLHLWTVTIDQINWPIMTDIPLHSTSVPLLCRCGCGWLLTAPPMNSSKLERCVIRETFRRLTPRLVVCYISSGSTILDLIKLWRLTLTRNHATLLCLTSLLPCAMLRTASDLPGHDSTSQRILHGLLPQHLPRRRSTCEFIIDQQVRHAEPV